MNIFFISPRNTTILAGFLFFFFSAFLHSTGTAYAATFTWTANDPIENVQGYKIYYSTVSGQYNSEDFVDVGNTTTCEIELTFASVLENGTPYYFVITAYSDTSTSDYSENEVAYTYYADESTTPAIDTDNDGLTDDDEITIYNTDPLNDDTDNDGISDGDEISQGTDPTAAQLSVSLLSPEDGATVPAGDVILSCGAVSETSDISHITLFSDISGSWGEDAIYYAGEISSTEPGLIGLYHFNDSIYNSISDEVDVESNIEFSTTSQFGSSAYFSGYDNSITAANTDGRFDITEELTLEAWFYPTDSTPWDYIISKASDTFSYPYVNYAIGYYSSTSSLLFAVSIDGQKYMVMTNEIPLNQWHHIVGTFSSSDNVLNIYLDGQLADSLEVSGSLDTTSTDLLIGGYQYRDDESLNGYIDEIAIYDRALTAEEVSEHYAFNFRNAVADFPTQLNEARTYEWNCKATDTVNQAAFSQTNTFSTVLEAMPKEEQTVYEDGEDSTTSGWTIYDNDPSGATISNVFDQDRQSRVILLEGDEFQNGYLLRNEDFSNWQNSNQFLATWSMKFSEYYTVYFNIQTDIGQIYLYYTPVDENKQISENYIHVGLGTNTASGEWVTITRDLLQDLQSILPGATILEINSFLIRGSGSVDDISLSHNRNIYEDAESGTIDGWDIYDNSPEGATITNVFDTDTQSRVIQLKGEGFQNGYRLRNKDFSYWQNNTQFVATWSMKFSEYYTIYFNIQTDIGQIFLYYTPVDENKPISENYIHVGLGTNTASGEWVTISRDLSQDIQRLLPESTILEINSLLVRGSGSMDNISLSN